MDKHFFIFNFLNYISHGNFRISKFVHSQADLLRHNLRSAKAYNQIEDTRELLYSLFRFHKNKLYILYGIVYTINSGQSIKIIIAKTKKKRDVQI